MIESTLRAEFCTAAKLTYESRSQDSSENLVSADAITECVNEYLKTTSQLPSSQVKASSSAAAQHSDSDAVESSEKTTAEPGLVSVDPNPDTETGELIELIQSECEEKVRELFQERITRVIEANFQPEVLEIVKDRCLAHRNKCEDLRAQLDHLKCEEKLLTTKLKQTRSEKLKAIAENKHKPVISADLEVVNDATKVAFGRNDDSNNVMDEVKPGGSFDKNLDLSSYADMHSAAQQLNSDILGIKRRKIQVAVNEQELRSITKVITRKRPIGC